MMIYGTVNGARLGLAATLVLLGAWAAPEAGAAPPPPRPSPGRPGPAKAPPGAAFKADVQKRARLTRFNAPLVPAQKRAPIAHKPFPLIDPATRKPVKPDAL